MLTNKSLSKILFLFHDRHEYHVREVARQTNLNQNSVVNYLKLLEKESILTSRMDANLKKYKLQRNKKAFAILTILDTDQLEHLPLLRKNAINTYVNMLPKILFAVVFSSTAKFRDDSDIDILIITDNRIDTKKAEKEANALQGIRISTFQMTYDDFIKELKLKEDSVIQSAIESGFPIINHIRYYETIMPWI